MLKLLKISKLPSHIDELCLQSTPHSCAWLQATSPQIQQTPNLAELESQALYPAYEGECFNVALVVQAEASLRSWRAWAPRIALVETKCSVGRSDARFDATN